MSSVSTTADFEYPKLFEVYRDYVKHEDNLKNFRSTWNITIQSFLVATYGFTIQKMLEVFEHGILYRASGEKILYAYLLICCAICFTGAACNFLTILSVGAAAKAITNLEEKWHIVLARNDVSVEASDLVFLTGGNLVDPFGKSDKSQKWVQFWRSKSSSPAKRGRSIPMYIPVTLIGFWISALAFNAFLACEISRERPVRPETSVERPPSPLHSADGRPLQRTPPQYDR
jgi:hypothetical protein